MSASQSSAAVWSAVASVTKLGDCWFVESCVKGCCAKG
jgi:hypothetical protein